MGSQTAIAHTSPETRLRRLVSWNKRNPALWVTVVMFFASCLFAYGFARAQHWTTGVNAGQMSSFCEWDCLWYAHTIENGYDVFPDRDWGHDAANWVFFPLFPLSAKLCGYLLHLNPPTAAVLTAKIEFFLAIFAFLLWLQPHLENTNEYFLAAALVAFNPYLIYAHAGYTEPLYFALCCFGFWALERQKWLLAGIFGLGVSATRAVGVIFALVYCIAVVRNVGWRGFLKDRSLTIPLGLVLCPLGTVLFAIYLYHHTGDAMAFSHLHRAWGRASSNPITVLANAYHARGWLRVWGCMGVAALLVSAWLIWRHLEYGLFLAINIIVPLSVGLMGLPYGLPRFIWWQAPLFFAIYLWLRRSVPAQIVYFAFAGGMTAFMIAAWFSRATFVV